MRRWRTSDGPAVVDGTTVTQALTGEATGAIGVVWRVVSSDGHPVSGEYSFTVTAPVPENTPSAEPTPAESTTTSESPAPSAEPSSTPAAQQQDEAGSVVPWVVLGVAVLVAAALVAYLVISRARRSRTGSGGTAGR
jgi:copper resistance protein C